MQDIWPICLLLGACALFADIFVRRVALDYAYPLKWLAKRLKPGESIQDMERKQSLQRLRDKKSEVSGEMEQTRSSTRFEAAEGSDPAILDNALSAAKGAEIKAAQRSSTLPGMATKDEPGGYTARLLAAKKAAQKKQADGEN